MVSVIIPIFNVEKYIERCLLSVISQKNTSIEVILVDDCGKDNSMTIAQSVLKKSGFTQYQIINHEKNKGLSAARNTGLSVAKGEYVYFLDSDDWLSNELVIKNMLDIATENKALCVVGEYTDCVDTTGEKIATPYQYGNQQQLSTASAVVECFVDKRIPVTAWNKLIKRDFLIQHGLFFTEGILHEDSLWTFQVMAALDSLTLYPSVTYHYAINPNSIMNQINDAKMKHRLDSSLVVIREMKKCAENLKDLELQKKMHLYIEDTKVYMYRKFLIDGLAKDKLKEFYASTHNKMPFSDWLHLSIKEKISHFDKLLSTNSGFHYFIFLFKYFYAK